MTHDLLHGEFSAAVVDNVYLLIGLPLLAVWSLWQARRGRPVLSPVLLVMLVVTATAWTVVRNLPGFPWFRQCSALDPPTRLCSGVVTRRAKIVCTLGPATTSDAMVKALVEAGMDVARLNFSHGDHGDHEASYHRVRKASEATGRAVGILADLQGPKIRLGRFAEGKTVWANGETVRITVDDCEGTTTGSRPPTSSSRPTPNPVTGCWSTTARSRSSASTSPAATWCAPSPRAAR